VVKDNISQKIRDAFSHLDSALISEILKVSILKTHKSNTELLREGQYIKVIPLVIKGLIKVYTRYDDRELLLYYIQPKESCIMSFSACLNNNPSQIFAVTEEDSTILLLPVDKVSALAKQFPDFNTLFFQQYNQRYGELLNTIHHVLFDKIDKRLFEHLKNKTKVLNQNPIKISHQQIANELGTVREVISRVLKKLEAEGLVTQNSKGIELIQM
jgi:CRP/FNR family transcriptional regulator